jgi:phosphatidate cytidylyltransferase
VAILALHQNGEEGPLLLLFLLVLIWVADSGAYFAGHRWGKRKLAPVISPGKSWEGVYGALVGASLCGAVLAWYQQDEAGALWLIPVSVVTVAISVVGDLFESILKRRMDMKDSGNLLPGHGGMLDRIDSLTAAAPVFALGLQLTIGL